MIRVLLCVVCTWTGSALAESVEVGPVWSGHPVGFALLTHGDRQYVAYYDDERRMTVAARTLDEEAWDKAVLPETLGWDSHNYVTLAVDDDGQLHLSGNMHATPLVYFRTREPGDIHTFERASMVGDRESRVTYPKFLRGAREELIFTYRDGSSGSGDQIYNVYDVESKAWRRLLDTPLTDGEGRMNAYFHGPVRLADGRFHVAWVWRDHPGCESNHDPCYARSADLVHWETASGRPLELPITLDKADVVDPVPAGGGIINGNVKVGLDSQHRPVVSYHKFDEAGNTQAYSARFEGDEWKVYRTSDWDYRWDFQGGGAIEFEIRLGSVEVHGPGTLKQSYSHARHGSGAWLLDEATFQPRKEDEPKPTPPAAAEKVESDFPGMEVRRAGDLGKAPGPGVRYTLRWEALPPNRDRPREGALPPPSMLRVIKHTRGPKRE